VLDAVSDADALIMAAAVADYRPAVVAAQKIKKKDDELRLDLTRTTDILYTVGQRKAEIGFPRVLVGFAAETQDLLENAQGKLERKNADLIVANDVSKPGAGFSGDTNIVTLLYRDGRREALDQRSKAEVAAEIIARISALLDS
jgi:phosphopantothenoylcysteine decarboxylase / phosphopantothenate---cysteine ligase